MVRLHRQETVITEKTNTTCDNVLNGPSSRMHGKICEAPHKPSYPNWFIYKGGEGGGGGRLGQYRCSIQAKAAHAVQFMLGQRLRPYGHQMKVNEPQLFSQNC